MNDKKILIIGSSGLFGTAMEKVCREAGVSHSGLTHKDLEISDKGQLECRIEDHKPDIIINTAAMMGIPACEEDPNKAFTVNAVAVLNLARMCGEREIILVQASTNTIFDGIKGRPYIETDIPNPQNIYGLSKYAGEKCVQNNLKSYYITRFPKLFGARRNKTPGFTDKMLERMRKRQEVRVADDRIDPFTYSLHAARKVLSLIESKAPFGIYHVANRGFVSYYDFIVRLAEKLRYNGPIVRAKDADFKSPYPNPLGTELASVKIHDMPTFEEALSEYVRNEKLSI